MRMAAVATAAGVAFGLGWLSRQSQVDAARREASTDGLTGLVNRSGLKRELRNRTNHSMPYTLYMLDLNGFKPVNDTYGHRAGDQLLQTIAHRLRAQLAGHLVTRLGGDEFMIVVAEISSDPYAAAFADRIARAVAAPIVVPGSVTLVSVTTAIGIVRSTGFRDYRLAMHAADRAMYESKSVGRPIVASLASCAAVDESPRKRVRDARPVRVA
jgi:diguanylate cyclase (GGDEF)-like protein